MADDTFLGVSRTHQLIGIGAIGALLVLVSYAPGVVRPRTAPTVFGIGLVMVAYAVLAGARDRLS
jgi:hypothetical protein